MEDRVRELEDILAENALELEKYSCDYSKLPELLEKKETLQSELDTAIAEWLDYIS